MNCKKTIISRKEPTPKSEYLDYFGAIEKKNTLKVRLREMSVRHHYRHHHHHRQNIRHTWFSNGFWLSNKPEASKHFALQSEDSKVPSKAHLHKLTSNFKTITVIRNELGQGNLSKKLGCRLVLTWITCPCTESLFFAGHVLFVRSPSVMKEFDFVKNCFRILKWHCARKTYHRSKGHNIYLYQIIINVINNL